MDDVGRVVDVDLDRVDLRCGESGCDQPNQVTVAVGQKGVEHSDLL